MFQKEMLSSLHLTSIDGYKITWNQSLADRSYRYSHYKSHKMATMNITQANVYYKMRKEASGKLVPGP